MRVCQICSNSNRQVIQGNYSNTELLLFECAGCGHRYIDGDVVQAWFDNYYLTQYITDDKSYSDTRLKSLAALVAEYEPFSVLDIGGTDGELQKALQRHSLSVDITGVGDVAKKKKYSAVILSHTLEHIYDIGAMFERIHNAMKKKGYLFVEIPIHLYDNYQAPQAYDYHWQHVNKFRPRDIEALFTRNGYAVEVSEQIEDYREYNVWRIVGKA